VTSLDGKDVFVTGADGFIGSHLVQLLVQNGARVRALCLYTSSGSLGWLDQLSADELANVQPILGDVRDAEFVRDAIVNFDFVFHLAALVAIPYSYTAPRSFVDTNVVGTLNVLEAVRRGTVGRLVHTSTSEVYGTPGTIPILESHPLQAQSPYSASKIAADKLCEAYARSFEVPVVTLRPFNTYGPRQSMRAVIPTILTQLLAGVTEVRLGSVTPRRDFTYVGDTCEGFVRAAIADLAKGDVVQLGTGTAISIGELFDLCVKILGVEAEVSAETERVRPDASEVQVLLSDPSQAASLLGWRPRIAIEEGLEKTAAWIAASGTIADPEAVIRYRV
jgi:NAD dependent epimerase/dehydratase